MSKAGEILQFIERCSFATLLSVNGNFIKVYPYSNTMFEDVIFFVVLLAK